MRLTSYNIAAKRLKAGCCMAIHVENMWRYMEEGDMVNAQCAREKALMLDALICTLNRWHPTISSGKTKSATFTIDSGTYSIPFISGPVTINGLLVGGNFVTYEDGNIGVFHSFQESINNLVSPNDDSVHVSSTAIDNQIILDITYVEYLSPISISAPTLDSPGVTVSATSTEEEDYVGVPSCLTDLQVLSIIKKIDELCEAECGC
tara:strand:- start:271 stop:888 length:618 start_codon:yes stop_codon:yes gene_type:complete